MTKETIRKTEMALVGAILMDENLDGKVFNMLSAKEFQFKDTMQIYMAEAILFREGTIIDPVTVLNKLGSCGLDDEEQSKILTQAMNNCPCIANLMAYAKAVKENSRMENIEVEDGINNN